MGYPFHRPVWPERLLELAGHLQGPAAPEVRGTFWTVLNLALTQRLRLHCRRLGWLDREKIQDLAAEKALDLMRKFDSGLWNPRDSAPGALVNFISTVARNALVDELRRQARYEAAPPEEKIDLSPSLHGRTEDPALVLERRQFVSHLVLCAERLKPEHRTIWLFRVLYDMPTRDIACHPEVLLEPGNVDMILSRCRDQIRRCLRLKGIESRDLPPGTHAELWRQFRLVSSLGAAP